MKTKFLIACIASISAFAVLAPSTASAHDHGRSSSGGYYVTKVVGYDHCGRPIYRQVWVPTSCEPSHGGGHNHGGGHSHGGGGGGFIHAPGIDIHFGSSSSGHHHRR